MRRPATAGRRVDFIEVLIFCLLLVRLDAKAVNGFFDFLAKSNQRIGNIFVTIANQSIQCNLISGAFPGRTKAAMCALLRIFTSGLPLLTIENASHFVTSARRFP